MFFWGFQESVGVLCGTSRQDYPPYRGPRGRSAFWEMSLYRRYCITISLQRLPRDSKPFQNGKASPQNRLSLRDHVFKDKKWPPSSPDISLIFPIFDRDPLFEKSVGRWYFAVSGWLSQKPTLIGLIESRPEIPAMTFGDSCYSFPWKYLRVYLPFLSFLIFLWFILPSVFSEVPAKHFFMIWKMRRNDLMSISWQVYPWKKIWWHQKNVSAKLKQWKAEKINKFFLEFSVYIRVA